MTAMGRRAATLPLLLTDLLVSALGVWAFSGWLCVYGHLSFTTCLWISPLSLGVGAAWAAHLQRRRLRAAPERPDAAEARAELGPADSRTWRLLSALSFVVFGAGVYASWSTESTLWWALGAIVHVGVVCARVGGRERHGPIDVSARPIDLIALALTAAAGAITALWVVIPNIDDAYYLNAVLFTLEQPELPLLAYDGMHGEPGVPIQQLIHRPQLFEALVSLVTFALGIDPRACFYLVVPALFAAAASLGHWLVLRTWLGRHAWIALPVVLLTLAAWGGGFRSYGQFGYVRMFHGKGVLITFAVPVVLYYGFQYARAPSWRALVSFSLAQCFSAMLSSTGLIVTPVAAAVAVLGAAPWTRSSLKYIALGALASAPVIAIGVLVKLELASGGALLNEGVSRTLWVPLGGVNKGAAGLLLAFSLPLALTLLRAPQRWWVSKLVAVTLLLVFNPWTGALLGSASARLISWRMFFAVPLPLMVAATVVCGGELLYGAVRSGRDRWPRMALGLVITISLMLFLRVGHWTHQRNDGRFDFAAYKLPLTAMEVSAAILEHVEPGSVLLASRSVTTWMTTYPNRPQIVWVRPAYNKNLERYWGAEESWARERLMRMTLGGYSTAAALDPVARQLDERCVDLVVIKGKRNNTPLVRRRLVARKFRLVERVRGYFVYKRLVRPPRCRYLPRYPRGVHRFPGA